MAEQGGVYDYRSEGKLLGYRIVYFDFRGRRHEEKRRGWTKRKADERWLDLTSRALRERTGGAVAADTTTLGEFAREHFFKARAAEVRGSTHELEERTYRLHIMRQLGRKKLSELTPDVVRAWILALRSKAEQLPLAAGDEALAPKKKSKPARRLLSPATQRLVERLLCRIVNRAGADGFFGEPSRYVKPWHGLHVQRAPIMERPRIEGADGFNALLAAAAGEGREVFIAVALALYCGLRRNEIPGLRWGKDIVFSDAGVTVTVPTERAKGKEEESLSIGRPDVVAVIRAQHEAAVAVGASTLFFHARRRFHRGRIVAEAGAPKLGVMHESTWARVKRAAGAPPRLRLHDLRGSYGMELLAQGYSVLEVSKLMRHKSLYTTQSYYLRVDREAKGHEAAADLAKHAASPVPGVSELL